MTHLWGTKSRTGVDHCLEALLNHLGFYLPKLWPKSTQILKSTEICCCTCSHVKKITHVSPWRKVPSCLQKTETWRVHHLKAYNESIAHQLLPPQKKGIGPDLAMVVAKTSITLGTKHLRKKGGRDFWGWRSWKGQNVCFSFGGVGYVEIIFPRLKKKAKGDAGQGPHLERSWCGVAIHFEDVLVLAKRTNAQTLISLIGGDTSV